MKSSRQPGKVRRRGVTMLEMAVVLAVLLTLLTVLMFGARAWKRGSDRAGCILMTRNVQLSVRSYQNLYGYDPGAEVPEVEGTHDIARQLYDRDFISATIFRQAAGFEACVGGGKYLRDDPNRFPPAGELYLKCSLAETADHRPPQAADW